MKQKMATLRARWDDLEQGQTMLLGVFSGLVTTLVPAYIFGGDAYVVGFICLYPFVACLTLRAFFIGPYFHHFFATKFGIFCVSWFFTFVFLGWGFFGLT